MSTTLPHPTATAPKRPFASLAEVLEAIRAGKMVVLVDDESRENEGDLMMAAELITPEAVNFMETHARGWIVVPLEPQRCRDLGLSLMVENGTERHGTAFTQTVDFAQGTTTGISAADQALTIRKLTDPAARPQEFLRPGHVHPLIYREGGVLVRDGHTEASVDLVRLAGLQPAAVLCEIKKPDGSMARLPDLLEFVDRHGLLIYSIQDLIAERMKREILVERVAGPLLPTEYGNFRIYAYRSKLNSAEEHVALVMGDLDPEEPTLVRVHSECLTGDVFHSRRCDCRDQLEEAMARIAQEGRGVLLYLRQEGRGIGLFNKLRAYELQDQGQDTVEANLSLGFDPDKRDYGIGAQILRDLGLRKIKVLTNNPHKLSRLKGYGLEAVERMPLVVPAHETNQRYLETKRTKMGHLMDGWTGSEAAEIPSPT
ncbi:MAG TPA: bifunctional 3,4-dihydroxy-2-butanone-4-phosphate synthase/GTP cyclohydrolase II [bacterium]|nr:bifunctional 3,4-dihydroxy-2-butanone-4-phosphate synthase/GTP cyclohydrolase II [bacterium]